MLDGASTPAVPAVARFAVDRLDVDVDGEGLTVEGRWSGIRGLRFLRPTLVVDGRPVLATLEHKPWAASEHEPWTAIFPWTGDPERLRRAWLQVAPSVVVPLGDGSRARPEPAAPVAAMVGATAPDAGPVAEPAPTEVTATGRELEDVRRELRSVQAERDRAEAMRDEAVRDREAALRTRERTSRAREQAVAERDAARADGDTARGAHEQVRVQRDEALAAYRRVEEMLRHRRAEDDRDEDDVADTGLADADADADADGTPQDSAPAPAPAPADAPVQPADPPEPSEPARPHPGTLSAFDHWALRVLTITAATCFVLLLFLLVRVFV